MGTLTGASYGSRIIEESDVQLMGPELFGKDPRGGPAGLTCLGRSEDDDVAIFEVWWNPAKGKGNNEGNQDRPQDQNRTNATRDAPTRRPQKGTGGAHTDPGGQKGIKQFQGITNCCAK